jgi:hypothetical protein
VTFIDQDADLGVDEPFTRWCALVTYPAGHGHKFAGHTVRLRGDGSRWMAETRRDWHQAHGGTAVVQRQAWTPTAWEDVPEGGEAARVAPPNQPVDLVEPEGGETP